MILSRKSQVNFENVSHHIHLDDVDDDDDDNHDDNDDKFKMAITRPILKLQPQDFEW